MVSDAYQVQIARTLYNNVYRCRLLDSVGNVKGFLRVLPSLPLDRSQVPQDAPKAVPFLYVIVEDADINKDNLIDFEERTAYALMLRFATETVNFDHCEFYYPSPAFVFDDKRADENNPYLM